MLPGRRWWGRLSLLSLDGPAFVLLAWAAGGGASTSAWRDAVLSSSLVWAGYVVERWSDAKVRPSESSPRHRFAARHLGILLGFAGLVAAAALVAGARLPVMAKGGEDWPGGAVAACVAGVFVFREEAASWAPRTLCVTFFMAAMAAWGLSPPSSLLAVAALALSNLSAIRQAESAQGGDGRKMSAVAAAMAAACLLLHPSPLTAACLAGSLACLFLGRTARGLPDGRRSLVDAATFVPLALAAVSA